MIYLLCPAGHPNFGDELIAAAWVRQLAARCPDERVIVDCHSPGKVAHLLAGLHPNLVITDTCWRLGLSANPPGGRPGAAVVDLGLAPDYGAGLRALREAHTLHVLGGGWLTALWPHHTAVLEVVTQAAECSGARLVATGHGVVPLGATAAEFHRLFRCFDLWDVRDGASAAALEGVLVPGVLRCTGDDAWLADPAALGGEQARPGGIDLGERGVVLCAQGDLLATPPEGTEADPLDVVADRVLEVLRSWEVTGDQLAVIEGVPGVDIQVFQRMCRRAPSTLRLEDARVVAFVDLWAQGLPTAGHTWLSSRFHPHLVASAAGAPGAVLAAHGPEYYSTKHRSVRAAGSRWSTVALDGEIPAPGEGMSRESAQQARCAKETLATELYGPR